MSVGGYEGPFFQTLNLPPFTDRFFLVQKITLFISFCKKYLEIRLPFLSFVCNKDPARSYNF